MNDTDTAVTIMNYKRRRKTNLYVIIKFNENTYILVIIVIMKI